MQMQKIWAQQPRHIVGVRGLTPQFLSKMTERAVSTHVQLAVDIGFSD